jgi:hypothetical protein
MTGNLRLRLHTAANIVIIVAGTVTFLMVSWMLLQGAHRGVVSDPLLRGETLPNVPTVDYRSSTKTIIVFISTRCR